MKQYFTLDLFRATLLLSLSLSPFLFRSLFRILLFPISLLFSKLLGEHCLHELHHKRSRQNQFSSFAGRNWKVTTNICPDLLKARNAPSLKTIGRLRSIIAGRYLRARISYDRLSKRRTYRNSIFLQTLVH